MSGVGSKRSFDVATGHSNNFVYDSPIVVEDVQRCKTEDKAKPVGGVAGGSPYEFEIGWENNTFLDMSSLSLRTRGKIVRPDGTDLQHNDIVAPVNLFASSLWSRVEVIIDDKTNNQSSADYFNFKSYLETLLSYEGDARESHLRTQMFYLDTPGRMENAVTRVAGPVQPNAGFVSRYNLARNSRSFECVCPLPTDLLRSSKHLGPRIKITLRLTKAPDSFLLIAPRDDVRYRFVIEDLVLKFNRIEHYDNKFKLPRIQRYPFPKTEMRRVTVPPHLQNFSFNVQNAGLIPKQILFFMVKTSAADGNYAWNPYNFHHFGLKRARLRVEGKMVPTDGWEFDWASPHPMVMDNLADVYKNVGVYRTDRGCSLSPDGYAGGQFIIAYDLTPDMCNGRHLHQSKTGSVSLDLDWHEPLDEPICIFAHCVFDAVYVKTEGAMGMELEYI